MSRQTRAEVLDRSGAHDHPVAVSTLESIQRRVLWLAVRMVDVANHERPNAGGIKVGGHQASSASMVSIMTALWFSFLGPEDRVSVKPHASPVFHAIQYLLGRLDQSYLTTLRSFGGLQSYPSRTKDPDDVDFSTGSVGLGAVAPLFASLVRRYVDAHFGERQASRFVSILGDAELDEGNVWEAIAEASTQGLGNVMWIVDFNRQSLDRVVPGIRIAQWRATFKAAGWNVVEAKYGKHIDAFFEERHGNAFRRWIDAMSNETYQELFNLEGDELRNAFLDGAPARVQKTAATLSNSDLEHLVKDLAGHDMTSLLEAFTACDAITDRPSVIFAYTIKGWGLPMAGNARNHSALLSVAQIDELRARVGLTLDTEWDRFPADSPEGLLCTSRAEFLERKEVATSSGPTVPVSVMPEAAGGSVSTQETLGRILVGLSREEAVAPFLVTTAPDVATSTNLAGFINRTGVFTPHERASFAGTSPVKWHEGPSGQHLELGISEMNLFLLLGQLGLSREISAQGLIPIGTVYDPFVCRGLDAFIYSVYSGARFIVVGTPSGVTLAPEGGAHQSSITASIGLELPNVTYLEPAYAKALDWLFCDAAADVASASDRGGSYYFRLSTRPIDQRPFEEARQRLGDDRLRDDVVSGGYRLIDASALENAGAPSVHIVATGAVVPEAIQASNDLRGEGVAAHVIDLTSPDRLFRAWRSTISSRVHPNRGPERPSRLHALFATVAPIVTVHDSSSHTLAWLGSALGVPCLPLGVDEFGQSGNIEDLYRINDLCAEAITNTALLAIDGFAGRESSGQHEP